MMNVYSQGLLREIDERCASLPSERVAGMGMALLTLYLSQAPHCSAEQLALFDDALLALVRRLHPGALREVSQRLAASGSSPAATLAYLAESADIAVAGPVLRQADLPQEVLEATIAGQRAAFLMAIASRRIISSEVSIALIGSGVPSVIDQVVKNQGAVLSELAFSVLIGHAAKDRELARSISIREDVPEELRSFIDMMLQ